MKFILITNYNNEMELNSSIKNVMPLLKIRNDILIITVSNYNYKNDNVDYHINATNYKTNNYYIIGMQYIKSLNMYSEKIIIFLDSDDLVYSNKLDVLKYEFDYSYIHNYLALSDNSGILKTVKSYMSGLTINLNDYNLNFLSKFSIYGFDIILYLYTVENKLKIKNYKKILNIYMINYNSLTHSENFYKNVLNEYYKALYLFKNKKTLKWLKKAIYNLELNVNYYNLNNINFIDMLNYLKTLNLNIKNNTIKLIKIFNLLLPYKYKKLLFNKLKL